MAPSKRNGKIELLRFLFAVCVLIFHINKRLFGTNGIHAGPVYFFAHGCFGVEFFFLVSGYLLGKKAFDMRSAENTDLGAETYRVIKKKLASVFPMSFTATALTMLVNSFALYSSWKDRLDYILISWPSLFLLNLFGFESSWVNKLTWYLSAYLMSTAILYPLARRYYSMFTSVICPMGALFILGWMDHTIGHLYGTNSWTGFCYTSLLRGFAEMALGIFAFRLTQHLNRRTLSPALRAFLCAAEPVGYLFIFCYINMKLMHHNEFPMLFLTMLLMVLSFSEVNPMEEVFNRPLIYRLGALSLPLYLNQFYVIRFVTVITEPYGNFIAKAILCIAGSIVCAIVTEKFLARIFRKRSKL